MFSDQRRLGLRQEIARRADRAVFDFLGHPSVLVVVDPEFRVFDLICDMVEKAGERAAIVDLGVIAKRAKA